MNLKERAKLYAIKAHKGQVRKSEKDKPMIMHPINVGMLLEEYGYNDDELIAAAYLHDVVEDTPHTFEDLEKGFGNLVASYVYGASEPDKSLSWTERKQHTINETKTLSLKNKLIICADKIDNLEDMLLIFEKNGNRDFSCFKEGEQKQKWYYTNLYESLIHDENPDLPIFKRLKNIIDTLFYNKRNEYLDNIFSSEQEYYKKLKSLHAQRTELNKLKALCKLDKSFVIEFCATPQTGKTTTINNLYDFFKKDGFKIDLVEEFTSSNYFKQTLLPQMKDKSSAELNLAIVEEMEKQLQSTISKQNDIVLIDRSINDKIIWLYRKFIQKEMTEEQYIKSIDKYSIISKKLIDMLIVDYADTQTALKKEHFNLSLKDRKVLNIENISSYNQSLQNSIHILKQNVDNFYLVDTTDIIPRDSSVLIAESIMKTMRSKYIKTFNETINISN